ncbi:maker270 [Drosophila busckii]|uniref:Maker270 n=1 Tax=Drosophila busckii TaxID=30019 RepID=A0A0M4F7T4_DROBS|nr:maker270 [Drosophila busckii]
MHILFLYQLHSFTTVNKQRKNMAGEGEKLTGLSKHFNGTTMAGRANVAKATYAVMGLLIAYQIMKPKKK